MTPQFAANNPPPPVRLSGAFAATRDSSSANRVCANWLYTYAQDGPVQVREATAFHRILADWSLSDITSQCNRQTNQRLDEDRVIICHVTDAEINGARLLLAVLKVNHEATPPQQCSYQFLLLDPYSLKIIAIDSDMLIFKGQDILTVKLSGSMKESEKEGSLLAVGTAHHVMSIFRLYLEPAHDNSAPCQVVIAEQPVRFDWAIPKNVSAIEFYPFPKSFSFLIFFGATDGKIGILTVKNGIVEAHQDCAKGFKDDGPVTHLRFDGPTLELSRKSGVLFVGRGSIEASVPSLAIYSINMETPSETMLIHQKALHSTFGEILAINYIRDGIGHCVYCATSTGPMFLDTFSCTDAEIAELERRNVDHLYESYILDIMTRGSSRDVIILTENSVDVVYNNLETNDDGLSSGSNFSIHVKDWFSSVAKAWPYTNSKVGEKLSRMRNSIGGSLFFDELIQKHGISDFNYPPRDLLDLYQNIEKIKKSSTETITKQELIYYLIKDFNCEVANDFAAQYMMPKSMVLIMDGYWQLDNFEFEEGIMSLLNSSKSIEFSNKIVKALYTHKELDLAYQFILAVNPVTSSYEDSEIRLQILLRRNVSDAFLYQRREQNPKLLETIFMDCFSATGSTSSRRKELLLLPYTTSEEQVLVSFCMESKSSQVDHKICKDFLLVYYIQRGRYIEAIKLYECDMIGQHESSKDEVISSLKKLIPEVQRTALEVEMEQHASNRSVFVKQSLQHSIRHTSQKVVIKTLMNQLSRDDIFVDHTFSDSGLAVSMDTSKPLSTSIPSPQETGTTEQMDVDTISSNITKKQAAAPKVSSPFFKPPITPRKDLLALKNHHENASPKLSLSDKENPTKSIPSEPAITPNRTQSNVASPFRSPMTSSAAALKSTTEPAAKGSSPIVKGSPLVSNSMSPLVNMSPFSKKRLDMGARFGYLDAQENQHVKSQSPKYRSPVIAKSAQTPLAEMSIDAMDEDRPKTPIPTTTANLDEKKSPVSTPYVRQLRQTPARANRMSMLQGLNSNAAASPSRAGTRSRKSAFGEHIVMASTPSGTEKTGKQKQAGKSKKGNSFSFGGEEEEEDVPMSIDELNGPVATPLKTRSAHSGNVETPKSGMRTRRMKQQK